jgi:hypothetical protein
MAAFARNGDRTGVAAKTLCLRPIPNGYLKRRSQPAHRSLHAGSDEGKGRAPSARYHSKWPIRVAT